MICFDFEVFRHDWLVVIIDEHGRETVIVNDADRLREFHKSHIDDIWLGYNSRNYDQWILKGLVAGFSAWDINDWIINRQRSGWEFSDVLKRIPLNTYDVFTGFHGLKTLEAFMGHDIRETSVPFDIDRPLTSEEIESTIGYCRHDVEETIEVFLRRADDFKAHIELLKSFRLPISLVSKTKAQLIAKILEARPTTYHDEFDLIIPDTLILERYSNVLDWYMKPSNRSYDKRLETRISGVPHVFAWGGVHGAIDRFHAKGRFLMIDVASLYPSLMIRYNLLSRTVKEASRYREIYETNLAMKRTHDSRRPAYKLVCNTTYGCMKDPYNPLYDPRMANCVCVAGQLLLLDLMEKLEGCCRLIQSNTDGLLVQVEDDLSETLLRGTVLEWEQRTGLHMEYTEFMEVWQKDVNNYLAIEPNGHVKSKGAYVKRLNDLDNDLPIVNLALREYMTHGTPVDKTIVSCDDLMQFQKIVHVSSKYRYAVWNGIKQTDRTFRVFASVRGGGQISKVKTTRREKFANTPDRCFIVNEDVTDAKVDDRLDKRWYIRLAQSRLKEFGA